MSTFKLRVISAEGRFFDGECESLVFPTLDGKTGILADHCNMLGAVSQGIAEFTTPDSTRHEVAVDEGFVKVEDNDVLLLVGIAEDPAKSEENRARREAQRLAEKAVAAAGKAFVLPVQLALLGPHPRIAALYHLLCRGKLLPRRHSRNVLLSITRMHHIL